MMSPERQLHFARLIVDAIWGDELVDYTDDDQALRVARTAIAQFMKEEDNLDEVVRAKIATLKRNVMEGSPEWDIMYSKYYEEEGRRRG
jgi:hypothetical protein